MSPGKLVVLTGPSGVGKGTIVRSLRQDHPDWFLSTSATTRDPRPGEIHGEAYYFISREEFQTLIAQGGLIEWAEYAGNYYGTPKKPVEDQIAAGKIVLLEIEVLGARQIKDLFPEALRIFIHPPSLEELEQRLRGRGEEKEEVIARRLAKAKEELAASGEFDQEIINDDLAQAIAAVAQAIAP